MARVGKRGRQPTPTKLKLLRGNPGRRPIVDEPEPEVAAECPAPPEYLLADAALEWKRIAPELWRLGLLTLLDVTALAGYCTSVARWREAEAWLKENGTTVVLRDKDGRVKYVQKAPQVAIAKEALERVKSFGAQFGMTPSSRSGLSKLPDVGKEKKGFFDAS